MQQFIAPRTLRVNDQPSPCECINEDDHSVICAFCVQANLIYWERENDPEADSKKMIDEIKKFGIRRLASSLNLPPSTVSNWVVRGHVTASQRPSVLKCIRSY